MTLSKLQKFGVAASMALATAFGMASQAQALDAKCGYSQAEISAGMRAEGQKPLVIGDRLVVGAASPQVIQLFTSDKDGNGYVIEGNQPSTRPSTSFCVAMKISNTRIYDARNSEIPASAFRGGRLDDALRAGQRNGQGVFLQANVVNFNNQTTDAIVTVGGQYSTGDGVLLSTPNSSSLSVTAGYEKLKYSAEALAVLDQPTRTAALALNR